MEEIKELGLCQGDENCSSCVTCWHRLLWLADTNYDEEPTIGYMPDSKGDCQNYKQRDFYGG